MDDSDFVPFIESNEGNIELDRENIQLPVLLNNLEVPWLLSLPSDDDIRQASNCSPLVRLHNESKFFANHFSSAVIFSLLSISFDILRLHLTNKF